MAQSELKPCPFCGNEPFVEIIRKGHAICGCSNANDCPANPEAWGRSRPKAIAAWNARAAPPPPSEPLVERVARAIYESVFDDRWPGDDSPDAEVCRNTALTAAQAALAALPAPADDVVSIPRELYAFLMGEGALDGVWFGDDPLPSVKDGAFWWRKALRRAALAKVKG